MAGGCRPDVPVGGGALGMVEAGHGEVQGIGAEPGEQRQVGPATRAEVARAAGRRGIFRRFARQPAERRARHRGPGGDDAACGAPADRAVAVSDIVQRRGDGVAQIAAMATAGMGLGHGESSSRECQHKPDLPCAAATSQDERIPLSGGARDRSALLPLAAVRLIVGGYALRRWDFPGEAFWPAAERLNYFILFPALLFSNLATAPLDDPGLARQALAVLLGLGVAWLALLLCKRWRGWDAGRFGAIAQGVLRFNTYLGLAAVGSLYGKPGLTLAALMLALMVPTVNVMSVWALTAERGISLRALLLPILKNPLILACLAGALVNLAGVGLPGGSDRLLNLLAVASLPLGLLCVGAALKPQELGGEVAALGWNCAARLLAMPLLAFAIARGLGLPSMESAVLVLFFALPTAPTAYVLTRQLGGDGHLMAGIITLQTLLSGATLVGVLLVLQGSP